MANRTFCDGCDRDITDDMQVNVQIMVPPKTVDDIIKRLSWQYCRTCALEHIPASIESLSQ